MESITLGLILGSIAICILFGILLIFSFVANAMDDMPVMCTFEDWCDQNEDEIFSRMEAEGQTSYLDFPERLQRENEEGYREYAARFHELVAKSVRMKQAETAEKIRRQDSLSSI